MPEKVGGNVLAWGVENMEQGTLLQAAKASRLPFVEGHVALMPDAHVGIGATVGSVIPTLGAIIPAAVGVDIGCGMVAAQTPWTASSLPDTLDHLMPLIERRIPAGVGKGREKDVPGEGRVRAPRELTEKPAFLYMDQRLRAIALNQLGSLGSGNHFVEVCLDQDDAVWVVLHSGSRGVGNKLAQHHIKIAKGLMRDYFVQLEDQDLAYLVEGTPQFDAYINDMLWAQDYAYANRQVMMEWALRSLSEVLMLPGVDSCRTVNCHHNYTTKEQHHGKSVWLTRKGAISAREGQRGVIPGSMGASSYIVKGLGNAASYFSASHGAGRRMSRSRARAELGVEGLRSAMEGKTWNANKAGALLDESPAAYKDIDEVMAAQADLVEITHSLHQVFNYKGA